MTAKKNGKVQQGHYDVVILGGGNAALCAAITAARLGSSVIILEAAPKDWRGGNSRHTRNLRLAHDESNEVLTAPYTVEEFYSDLMRVTDGETDEDLARFTLEQSSELWDWLLEQGVRFQPSLGGTLQLSHTNAFFLGGGKALMNAMYRTAEAMGVEVRYDTEVVDLGFDDGHFTQATVRLADGSQEIIAGQSLVAAAGGFEANIEWLREYWGDAADNFIVRGTPYNRGGVLRLMLDNGMMAVGDPKQCHAVALDARAPKFDGGIVTRLDCVSLGIVVNADGDRFYDEGEDFWPKRYAIWGRLIAHQPDQIAHVIIDEKAQGLFMPSVFKPVTSDTIAGIATQLDLDPAKLEDTVATYNAAVVPGTFDTQRLDDCRTEQLDPPKTHWARRIDTPPFYGYSLRPGITFTYLGVRVNRNAQVLMADGRPTSNVFAAGEIMAGNVLGKGYLAGIGMTIGAVFGRIAGREAARRARN
ncbi:FAD-dependent tricarballylate dehydrogenase TcuA [Algihabitans albus]|uniref:FAD-dependent tricarballylate dehydrogenase TcuA n=1 Tax=Algihabitans albus TaxID=2164067 RepID=UPI000E5CC055|nr:FAD-dependent tricarballylate dehydrogenase TcuA [Algihabitans albus]